MLKLILLVLNCYFVASNPFSFRDAACQKACHELDDKKINVHFIPHSHDDVGWLKTYDEYYDGTGKFDSIQNAGVSYILNSTIQALTKNENRRYIQVETAFFWKWWNDQPTETRNLVKDMVNKGQLEMINGGWSMNDEAAAHYQSIIDQFTWGFRILEDTVGECGRPTIGWQIDPFGHSREHASLVKQMGFDGLVVGRIDFRDKQQRIQDKNLDFIWNTNDNFEASEAEIFTTMFPNFYVYEEGFCFDVYCSDAELTDENLADKVKAFKSILDKYKNYYKTRNIMIPMGHDFSYQKADKNFDNIDKLIKGFAEDDTYNVIYSTPSCYIQAVKDEVANSNDQIQLTVKTDDFFPYASDTHSFWTGYFTSRPTSKRFERVGNNILQSAKQLTTFSRVEGHDDDKNILDLRMAMGVMQHHDAITGTEKQAVANNYAFLLDEAIKETEEPVTNIIGDLLKKSEDSKFDLKFSYCLLANMSICDNSQKKSFVVAIHNPLSKTVSHYVRLPVEGSNYKITGPEDDQDIQFDIFETINSFDFVTGSKPASKEITFLAKDLPPLGVKLYYIEQVDDGSDSFHQFEDVADQKSFGDETTNGFTIDDKGKLETVTINGQTINIQQDFYYYKGFADSQSGEDHRASGAYIFRPDGDAAPIADDLVSVKFAKGSLVDEVLQVFDGEITQIIRVYKGEKDFYIEFDWLVGDLQRDSEGKEIITRFQVAEFENNEIFYTDANGRQQIKRRRNRRNDYDYVFSEEHVSSNYYPVISKIVIKGEKDDKELDIAVLNDRPQGGTSLHEGEIELMVHRRDKKDDGFGVEEVLDEQQYGKGLYARGQHYLTFGTVEDGKPSPAVFERDLAHKKLLAPVVLVADATDVALADLQAEVNFKFEALKKSLPDNVQILTLEPWKDSYLLRLEHIFEKEEDKTLSVDATVDLTELFTLFNITELTPATLGANQNLDSSKSSAFFKFPLALKATAAAPDLKVTLKPMEIKTFIFKTDKNNDGGHDNGIIERKDDDSSSAEALNSISFLIVLISSIYTLFY